MATSAFEAESFVCIALPVLEGLDGVEVRYGDLLPLGDVADRPQPVCERVPIPLRCCVGAAAVIDFLPCYQYIEILCDAP